MSSISTKQCSKCRKTLSLSEFSKRKRSKEGYRGTCKSCRYKDRKRWLNNGGKEVDAKIARNYRKTDKEKNSTLIRNYGISLEDWNNLFELQGGRCAICKVPQSDLNSSLCVDHDHYSGKVRGLLCRHCNLVLGRVNEDSNIAQNLVRYINEFCI